MTVFMLHAIRYEHNMNYFINIDTIWPLAENVYVEIILFR